MIVGDTQQKLLAQLLEFKAGLTVDELASAVDSPQCGEAAFVGHGTVGLCAAHVVKEWWPATLPVHADGERNYPFPKRYSWFSWVMLESLRKNIGASKFGAYTFHLGSTCRRRRSRTGGQERVERVGREIVKIMNETGFAARVSHPAKVKSFPVSSARTACFTTSRRITPRSAN